MKNLTFGFLMFSSAFVNADESKFKVKIDTSRLSQYGYGLSGNANRFMEENLDLSSL